MRESKCICVADTHTYPTNVVVLLFIQVSRGLLCVFNACPAGACILLGDCFVLLLLLLSCMSGSSARLNAMKHRAKRVKWNEKVTKQKTFKATTNSVSISVESSTPYSNATCCGSGCGEITAATKQRERKKKKTNTPYLFPVP